MNATSQDYYQTLALQTFRNLPPYLRKRINTQNVLQVLKVRDRYLSELDFMRKCLITNERLALILQYRLAKNGYSISRRALTRLLKAEEQFYQVLAEENPYQLMD